MNSLSWMIYFGDVSGGLVGFSIAMACVFGITSTGMSIAYVATASYPNDDDAVVFNKVAAKVIRWTIPVFALMALMACFVPSKNTVYAIAASELGEQALKSKTVTKAQAALDAWLDKQIGETKAAP
jgi:hypothetical protein